MTSYEILLFVVCFVGFLLMHRSAYATGYRTGRDEQFASDQAFMSAYIVTYSEEVYSKASDIVAVRLLNKLETDGFIKLTRLANGEPNEIKKITEDD